MRRLAGIAAVLTLGSIALAAGDTPASQPDNKAAAGQAYTELTEQLRTTQSPADGVALLEKFIATYPDAPMIEGARKATAEWKERADKGQVRWGTGWLGKEEVDKKNATAEQALNNANAAAEIEKQMKFLSDAATANPYRADIPFKRFQILLKANKEKDSLGALGKAMSLDPNNASVMNDLGVLHARQKQWGEAVQMLLKAAGKSPETDVIWDNFDQVCAMAQECGGGGAVSSADMQMRGLVAKIHKAGKHAGETRWGNSWVTEADYATKKKEATAAAGKNSVAANNLKGLQSRQENLRRQREDLDKRYGAGIQRPQSVINNLAQIEKTIKDLDTAIEKAKKEADTGASAEPTHSGKLILLSMDGTELESLEPKPADPDAGKVNKDNPDKPKPGKLF
ncbi:MAG: tetratricopeptide repeat protein [Phycisphaerae bacterium]|nr:tetratricopeptide repeat protein [Phycisphaerae bacterium]